MGTKTRSSSDLKAILSDVLSNKEVHTLLSQLVIANVGELLKTEVCNKLEIANNEIIKLKDEVMALKSEISMLRNENHEVSRVKDNRSSKNVNTQMINSNEQPVTIKERKKSTKTYAAVTEGVASDLASIKSSATKDPGGSSFKSTQSSRKKRPNVDKNSIYKPIKPIVSKSTVDRSKGLLIGSAKPKMAWLYIGKIKNKEATSDMIKEYISTENIHGDQIKIEKLESKGPYSSFMLGIPYDNLEKIGDPDYWPNGVVVRRYNFWMKRDMEAKNIDFLGQAPKVNQTDTV